MSRKIIASLLALACAAALATPALAGSKSVSVSDFKFGPSSMTIHRGTTVVWRWRNTDAPHNVTARTTPRGVRHFRSGTVAGNHTYRHRFTRAGTYRLVCTIHDGMRERITVR